MKKPKTIRIYPAPQKTSKCSFAHFFTNFFLRLQQILITVNKLPSNSTTLNHNHTE